MKFILKSKGAWLIAALLIATAALMALALWPKSPRQIISLANGDQYEFAGTAYATNLVPPTLLCHIANHLPAGLTNLAGRIFGNRMTWLKDSPPEHPELIVWFRRVKTAGPTPAPGPTILLAGVADENGVELGRENYGMMIPAFFERTMWAQSTFGWSYVALGNLPKRSPVLHVVFHQDVASDFQQITLPNPFYKSYPQWQPKDALPATRDLDDLHVEIGALKYQYQSGSGKYFRPGPSYMQTQVSWAPPPRTPPKWELLQASLDDATGNHLDEIPPHVFGSGPAIGRGLDFPVGFWPGEDAWRLKLAFKRVADFPPETVLTFTNVPIPPVGSTSFFPITESVGGVKVRLSQFSHGANSTNPNAPPYSSIAVDLPDHPADMQGDIIDLGTEFGRLATLSDWNSRVNPNPTVFLTYIPTNATIVNITVTIQKLRTVELYIKPPTP